MKLEERYMVFKLADVPADTDLRHVLEAVAAKYRARRQVLGKPPLEGLVLERDWPEYEPALRALEHRVNRPTVPFNRARFEAGELPFTRRGEPLLALVRVPNLGALMGLVQMPSGEVKTRRWNLWGVDTAGHPDLFYPAPDIRQDRAEEIRIEASELGFVHGSPDWEAFVERREAECLLTDEEILDLVPASSPEGTDTEWRVVYDAALLRFARAVESRVLERQS